MLELFHLGGWSMYPILIAGVALVVSAARYAFAPDERRLAVVRQLSRLTVLVSGLGFVIGVIRSFTAIGAAPAGRIDVAACALAGVGESLAPIALALVVLIAAAVWTTLGARRLTGRTG